METIYISKNFTKEDIDKIAKALRWGWLKALTFGLPPRIIVEK